MARFYAVVIPTTLESANRSIANDSAALPNERAGVAGPPPHDNVHLPAQ
ncbi:hypothetical protein [Burkholderia cepacia]|nr:hypothetical protein [Burkholderia cepacia]